MTYYNQNKKAYVFDERHPLGKGGEGAVYKIDSTTVAKILHSNKRGDVREKKLQAMIDSAIGQDTQFLAWPKEILYDDLGNFVGYTMPIMTGKTLSKASLDKKLSWENRLVLAINLAAAVNNVHIMGHTVGDLNINNVMYDITDGTLALIDCDSFNVTDPTTKQLFPCVVGKDEYIAPELQDNFSGKGKEPFTKESDYFSIAVIVFKLLAYDTHPFNVKVQAGPSTTKFSRVENIVNGRCIYFPETCRGSPITKPPSFKLDLDQIFPPNICELFRKTFVDGHKDPKARASAKEWYDALRDLLNHLKKCQHNGLHSYYDGFSECPLCLNEGGLSQIWICNACGRSNDEAISKYVCMHCGAKRYPGLPIKKILAVIALIAIVYLFVLPAVTNPDVPLIQFGDGSGSASQTSTVSPTESVILGAFTVTDGQNPSMSASFADGQTGVIYSNTLSFPYGSPYYVLGITDVVPPVTITASNMVPTNTQASLELLLKDSNGNNVDSIQLGSSDTKRSKKITIREAGDYTLIMDGKYVESVVITIEKT